MEKKTTIQVRRVPKQQRSRERYEKILATASQLIATRGNDAVSMREIAEAADIPIASIYQYFPDRNAVLWALVAEPLEQFETLWQQTLNAANSVEELLEAADQTFEQFVKECETEPLFARLWNSAQANAILTELDLAQNQRLAEFFADRMVALDPGQDRERIRINSLLMTSLASAAIQLAFSVEQDRDAILAAFRRLLSHGYTV